MRCGEAAEWRDFLKTLNSKLKPENSKLQTQNSKLIVNRD